MSEKPKNLDAEVWIGIEDKIKIPLDDTIEKGIEDSLKKRIKSDFERVNENVTELNNKIKDGYDTDKL